MYPASYAAGAPPCRPTLENWGSAPRRSLEPRESQDQVVEVELPACRFRRILVESTRRKAIVETARQGEEADLIMMPSYGYVFKEFSAWLIQRMAAEFGARLRWRTSQPTGVWGPAETTVTKIGGRPWWRPLHAYVARTSSGEMGVQANVFIGSGDVPRR